jgi:DNA-binding transcriptional LysR family regulator
MECIIRSMDLDAIAVFVKVVQAGSFSQAARLLGMPNTTVSAKVARLEKRLGVTLIRRTTRKLHVTPAGQAYFERCMRGLAEIETAEAQVSSAIAKPRGVLRITVPGDVAHSLLPPIASRYVRTYPEAKIDVMVANRVVDLVGEGIDLAIRAAGALKDSTLVARRFMPFVGGLWASPDYLARRGTPKRPVDLERHNCLAFSRVSREGLQLTDGREKIDVALHEPIAADDPETLCALVLQGDGIAPLPDFLARRHAAEDRLARVLPQWAWIRGELSFVYPSQPFVPANVRAFIDIAAEYAKELQSAQDA